MMDSANLTRIRSAIAALKFGEIQDSEFERIVEAEVAAGTLTRAQVQSEMEAAREVARTRYRAVPAHASRPNRNLQDTVIRPPTASPWTASVEEGGAKDTESNWVDPDAVPAAGTVAVGQLLGRRYRLERVLGRGGMGVVYLASDEEVSGEMFAVKVLKPEIREHPDSIQLLREEVRKARSLHHPNIAGVYSLNSDRSGIYMLMEYLEGKTLGALIDEEFGRGMPVMRAWPLIQDIGAALAYAHDHSVIHSDLKPSNIFITTSAKAKLLDFGVARAARGPTSQFDPNSLGALTPAYASCEMLEGRPANQSDDVYAFACVIYELLSGTHPFNNQSALEARAAGLRPAPLAALSRGQNEALAAALAFERARRTTTVETLLANLAIVPGRRTARLLWIGGGVVAAALLGVAGWYVATHFEFSLPGSNSPSRAAATTPVVAPTVIAEAAPSAPPPLPAAEPNSEMPTARSAPELPPPLPAPTMTAPPPALRDDDIPANRPLQAGSVTPATPLRRADPVAAAAPAMPAPAVRPVVAAESADTPPASAKNLPLLRLAPGYEAFADECRYPRAANGETGSVSLLAYVGPEGVVQNILIDSSSGSAPLDDAALACVREHAHFLPKSRATQKQGFWGHTQFNWYF